MGDQILFVQKSTSPSESYQYLHRDHIGSIVAITGSVVNTHADVQYLANGVWGERRFQQWNGPLDDSYVPAGTARGFTDHEHLDSVGLIHMNGRVYDQELGRFLSADPLIQAPHNTQSYNRYSYVFNNPLSFVDPSGFECGTSEDPRVSPGGVTIDCDGFTWYDQSIGTDAWYWAGVQQATANAAAEWDRHTASILQRFENAKITQMEAEVGAGVIALDQNFTLMADVVGGVATLPAGVGTVAGVAAVRVTAAAKSSSFLQTLFGALGTKGVKFGQANVKSTFAHGPFKGKTIGEVANGLRSGKISPDQLPVEFVVRNGERVALNNRSLTALRCAGMESTNLIDRTGSKIHERLLDSHLGGAQPSYFIRIRGAGSNASSIE